MSKIHWSVRYEPLREMFEARGIDRPELVLQFSLLSSQRIAGIIRACDAAQAVAGDTAEIGCASGGTTRLIALLMQRRHWACGGGLVILDDVIGRGTSGAKLFWSELDKRAWEVVEENDPHVIVRKL